MSYGLDRFLRRCKRNLDAIIYASGAGSDHDNHDYEFAHKKCAV